MRRITLTVWVLVIVLTSPGIMAGEEQDIQLQGAGILIMDNEFRKDKSRAAIRPNTTVFLRVEYKKGDVISITPEKCKILSFTDDKGTDLRAKMMKGAGYPLFDNPFSGNSFIQKGGHWYLPVGSHAIPAPDAKQFEIKGLISLIVGSGSMKTKVPSDKIKEGMSVNIGGSKLVFSNVKQTSFRMTFDKPLDFIQSITLNNFGKDSLGRAEGQGVRGGGKKQVYFSNIYFGRHIKGGTLSIAHYSKVKDLKVPFDTSIGLDLSANSVTNDKAQQNGSAPTGTGQ